MVTSHSPAPLVAAVTAFAATWRALPTSSLAAEATAVAEDVVREIDRLIRASAIPVDRAVGQAIAGWPLLRRDPGIALVVASWRAAVDALDEAGRAYVDPSRRGQRSKDEIEAAHTALWRAGASADGIQTALELRIEALLKADAAERERKDLVVQVARELRGDAAEPEPEPPLIPGVERLGLGRDRKTVTWADGTELRGAPVARKRKDKGRPVTLTSVEGRVLVALVLGRKPPVSGRPLRDALSRLREAGVRLEGRGAGARLAERYELSRDLRAAVAALPRRRRRTTR